MCLSVVSFEFILLGGYRSFESKNLYHHIWGVFHFYFLWIFFLYQPLLCFWNSMTQMVDLLISHRSLRMCSCLFSSFFLYSSDWIISVAPLSSQILSCHIHSCLEPVQWRFKFRCFLVLKFRLALGWFLCCELLYSHLSQVCLPLFASWSSVIVTSSKSVWSSSTQVFWELGLSSFVLTVGHSVLLLCMRHDFGFYPNSFEYVV